MWYGQRKWHFVSAIFETPDAPVSVPGGGEIQDHAPAISVMTGDIAGLERKVWSSSGTRRSGSRTLAVMKRDGPASCWLTASRGPGKNRLTNGVADMSRKARLSRNLPVDIDTKELLNIARQAGATHKQFMTAYSRALKRTAVTLRKRAMSDLKTGLAPATFQPYDAGSSPSDLAGQLNWTFSAYGSG